MLYKRRGHFILSNWENDQLIPRRARVDGSREDSYGSTHIIPKEIRLEAQRMI